MGPAVPPRSPLSRGARFPLGFGARVCDHERAPSGGGGVRPLPSPGEPGSRPRAAGFLAANSEKAHHQLVFWFRRRSETSSSVLSKCPCFRRRSRQKHSTGSQGTSARGGHFVVNFMPSLPQRTLFCSFLFSCVSVFLLTRSSLLVRVVFSVGSFVGNVRSVENKDGKLVVCIDVSAEL